MQAAKEWAEHLSEKRRNPLNQSMTPYFDVRFCHASHGNITLGVTLISRFGEEGRLSLSPSALRRTTNKDFSTI